MMKLIFLITSITLAVPAFAQESDSGAILLAQHNKVRKKAARSRRTKSTTSKTSGSRSSRSQSKSTSTGGNIVSQIKSLASNGQFQEASKLLFSISRNPKNAAEAAQLKYMLGLMLMELKLYQVASFVFYDVIDEEIKRPSSDGKYLRQALGKLSYLSNVLESDVLLKYAVSRIRIGEFPQESKDLFFYRYGELKLKEANYVEAAKAFSRVNPESQVFPQSLYKQGLAYAEDGKLAKSVAAYEELLRLYQDRPVTDSNRVNAELALARVYYQAKKWDAAVQYYRLIPRDTIQWHDALFEMSWAMMRTGQFRSASSNFHTLHSPYYEDVYMPEGLLLRGIVYLYICRYDEMEKVLDLFDKIYKPAQNNIVKMLQRSDDSRIYWDELKKTLDIDPKARDKRKFKRLNDMVLNALLKSPQIKSNMHYYSMLQEEDERIAKMGADWRSSAIGKFSNRIIDRRKASTQDLVGKLAKNNLLRMRSELRDFFEQGDFLKFEMLNGKKEVLAKEIAGKKIPHKQITDGASRDFFTLNGYEFWPFKGEYWLDELGNYHYVGVQACE
ncbi:MAG: tetratricopeptide repeat protein [Bdellovibrionaceae bacterium]|nr:tetratricopeptide repeat protein [Pseudobdellovibrionaceae bacterium]